MAISSQNKIEEIILEVIRVFLEENLKQEGQTQALADEEDQDDEDENFDKTEKTVRNENFDFFSKLMKQKVENSMMIIIQFIEQILQQYQVIIFPSFIYFRMPYLKISSNLSTVVKSSSATWSRQSIRYLVMECPQRIAEYRRFLNHSQIWPQTLL